MKIQCICNKCLISILAEPNSQHQDCSGFPNEIREGFPTEFKGLKNKPGYWMVASLFRNIKQVA